MQLFIAKPGRWRQFAREHNNKTRQMKDNLLGAESGVTDRETRAAHVDVLHHTGQLADHTLQQETICYNHPHKMILKKIFILQPASCNKLSSYNHLHRNINTHSLYNHPHGNVNTKLCNSVQPNLQKYFFRQTAM